MKPIQTKHITAKQVKNSQPAADRNLRKNPAPSDELPSLVPLQYVARKKSGGRIFQLKKAV